MAARDDPSWPTLSVFSGRGGAIAPPAPQEGGKGRATENPPSSFSWERRGRRIAWRVLEAGRSLITRTVDLTHSAYGLSLWYWKQYRRSWRTNPDTRLATMGLGGGVLFSLLLALLLHAVFPGPSASDLPPIDPSVPAPQLAWIEAVPGQQDESSPLPDSVPDPALPEDDTGAGQGDLSPQSFRFERFVRSDTAGNPAFLSRAVRQQVQAWYPAGTSATRLLQFMGEVIRRAGEERGGQPSTALSAAKKRCLHMPSNKVFTEGTIVCTYSHAMPALHAPGSTGSVPRPYALWMVAFSYDRKGLLTTLDVRARQIPGVGGMPPARARPRS